MKANNGTGVINPVDIELISEIHPMNGGKIAPPTIAITINEDAFFVCSPNPFIPSAKIVGNMIDIKKKIR